MMGFFDFEFNMDDIKKHQPPLQKLNKVIVCCGSLGIPKNRRSFIIGKSTTFD